MASLGPYFGNTMDLAMEREDATSIPIGLIKSVEVRLEAEETEYFSGDSTLREAVAHSQRVPVINGTVGSWDVAMAKAWLGGSGTTSTGLVDTTDPQKFTLTGEVTPVGGSTKYEVECVGVTMPTLPIFSANEDEFIGLDIEGRGDDFNILTEPS